MKFDTDYTSLILVDSLLQRGDRMVSYNAIKKNTTLGSFVDDEVDCE